MRVVLRAIGAGVGGGLFVASVLLVLTRRDLGSALQDAVAYGCALAVLTVVFLLTRNTPKGD